MSLAVLTDHSDQAAHSILKSRCKDKLPFTEYFCHSNTTCSQKVNTLANKRLSSLLLPTVNKADFVGTLLQKVLKTKLSSGKLHFWEWEKTLLVPEHLFPRPCWYITFLHAGNVFRHGGM
jgi:hypothetical protein